MRSMVFVGCAIVALGLSAAAYAAPAEPTSEANAGGAPGGDAPITFEQYRAWRLAAMERRRSEIDMQLAAADLSPARKARLEETKSLLQVAGRYAGSGTRQAFPRAIRAHRYQSRRGHQCRRAHGLARAAARLLRWRGQRRIAPAGERAAAGRKKGRGCSACCLRSATCPRRLQIGSRRPCVFARSVFACGNSESGPRAMLSCAQFAPGSTGLPRWAGLAIGRRAASFRRCCCHAGPISRSTSATAGIYVTSRRCAGSARSR